MAVEALIRSLRPPDRYPPRLGTLTAEQEAVVVAFLETLALGDGTSHLRDDAQQALEVWWLPGATLPAATRRCGRPPICKGDLSRRRESTIPPRAPSCLYEQRSAHIAEESRTVEVWRGTLCGDVPTTVAVNLTPLAGRHLQQIIERAAAGLRAASVEPRPFVSGATRSERLNGLATRGDSPTEPERIKIVAAVIGKEVALLTVRRWPRDDVEAAMERIVSTFEIVAGS